MRHAQTQDASDTCAPPAAHRAGLATGLVLGSLGALASCPGLACAGPGLHAHRAGPPATADLRPPLAADDEPAQADRAGHATRAPAPAIGRPAGGLRRTCASPQRHRSSPPRIGPRRPSPQPAAAGVGLGAPARPARTGLFASHGRHGPGHAPFGAETPSPFAQRR
ncbi:hypothetical protein GALL_289350 [mine drainage metagenome]|uniref:Uncharacterized protein n=1 Tax=mine drainage metagenome TaxID=410659 RepID=A0A1J5R141_9ZZZZ